MTTRAVGPSGRRALVNDSDLDYLIDGYRGLLPLGPDVERRLRGALADTLEHPGSLLRAQLAFRLLRARGAEPSPARDVAIAIEYFHAASLIFDDLPSMDDAELRRGRPCPHRVWGEAAATLSALALINQGYSLLWGAIGPLDEDVRRRAGSLVAEVLGVDGVLGGQAQDLQFHAQTRTDEDALRVAEGKTVSLIRLTLLLPAILAGAGPQTVSRLDRLATSWGLSYQILDDFSDCLASAEESGKTTARDQALARPNFASRAGFDRALARLSSMLCDAAHAVGDLVEHSPEWSILRSLQLLLEDERNQVAGRLAAAA